MTRPLGYTVAAGGGASTGPLNETDPTAVHITGDEIVTGVKTFISSPIVPAPSASGHAVSRGYADSAASNAAVAAASTVDAGAAHLSGAETIGGVKTFTAEPVMPSWKVTGTTGAPNQGRFVGVTTSGAPASGTYGVGDWALSQNGQMFVCTAAGTPGMWVHPRDASNLLTSGEETFPRLSRIDSSSLSNSRLQLTYFTARKSETTTGCRVLSGGVATATPTLVRVGLYTIAADGTAALVASTTNDATLLATANTAYTRTWSASYAKTAGQRYAVGVLVTGTTAGSVASITTSGFAAELAMTPRTAGHLAGQADLPATFTDAALAATTFPFYAAILP